MAELIATERSNIVAIADEIRALSGGNSDMTLGEIIDEVREANDEVGIQAELIQQIASVLEGKAGGSGGSTEIEDAMTTRSLSEYTNSRITEVGYGAFAYASKLTSVNFPNANTIANYAFVNCTNLTTLNFPAATNINYQTFANCYGLTSVNFPACTSIGNYTFNNCSNLKEVIFPSCTYMGASAFGNCKSLTVAYFEKAQSIAANAFLNCHRLSSLTLGASTVCTLSNSNAFASTPYAGYSAYYSGTPHIYVPASLASSYKTATNWAYFSSYFIKIAPVPLP